jgi:ubiquinone/menaquinone biosynthesis C-methylase UbiE
LFDTLSKLPPATSEEIAQKAGLNERYVREWLGAMVTGRIVDYDPTTGKYDLPAEHAAFTTRPAGADNIAVFAQYISVLGNVEDEIVECFRKGGGVPYSKFPRFHTVMAEDSGQSVLANLESAVLPVVPGMIDRLKQGIKVLDVGCGSGRALNLMARLYPQSHFTGYDFSVEAITRATEEAQQHGSKNIEFHVFDVTMLDAHEQFDFITAFDAIHDQAKPLEVLKGIHRALKPEGVFLMQDISGTSHVDQDTKHPIGPLLYTISCMHCMTVSLALGGEGLGAMWGVEKAKEYLRKAGFTQVDIKNLPHDFQNSYFIVRKN